jgi:urease accessory protein
MDPIAFVHSLQFADSFFPVGGFAYSDGLETATSRGDVSDARTLGDWMDHYVDRVLVPCEGLALAQCMTALERGDLETLCRVDQELTAIRPAAASRVASRSMGRRMLSLYAAIRPDEGFRDCAAMLPEANSATAHAVVFVHCGLNRREAIMAFGYKRLASIVSSALRLISMGQQQGQVLLTSRVACLPEVADRILGIIDLPLTSFTPQLDIHQMNHQYLYTRLFRS